MSDLVEKVKRALHDKLFAMNGYTKLPSSLEKTDDVCAVVIKAVAEWIERDLKADNVSLWTLRHQLEGSE